nr:uncharacterized protein LOC113400558 [Vanessa tameamea]
MAIAMRLSYAPYPLSASAVYSHPYISSQWDIETSKLKEDSAKQEWLRLFQIYKKILDTYDIYKKTFQVYTIHHSLKTFLIAMFYAEFILIMESQYGGRYVLTSWEIDRVLLLTIVVKDIMIIFFVSISCQVFYSTVNKARLACIKVINENKSDGAKETCKNVLRLSDVAFGKLQAGRIFVIDAKFPLLLLTPPIECNAKYLGKLPFVALFAVEDLKGSFNSI